MRPSDAEKFHTPRRHRVSVCTVNSETERDPLVAVSDLFAINIASDYLILACRVTFMLAYSTVWT